ncbi:MAG: IclR family transcriptional regulator [Tetrasphaera sp.]|jgi:DNA-binding IclR family transcriptional regulator|nr:IclR family transcriptional regulator [Tetrasphaera sp.]
MRTPSHGRPSDPPTIGGDVGAGTRAVTRGSLGPPGTSAGRRASDEVGASGKESPVQSVDRAATILDQLAEAGELGVTELARRLGVHKSTASRLVAALEKWELVEQVEGRGKYRLGIGLLRLAGTAVAGLDVVEQARPVCRRLAAETGLTVNLAVLSDNHALYLDQVAGTSALQSYNWVGQRIPLHATSNGKVLLSGLDRHTVRALVRTLTAYTPKTITDLARLEAELDHARTDGYAIAVDELEDGLAAIAAPVRNAHGEITNSLSLSGPTFRLDPARLRGLRRVLIPAATEVSRRLGWRGQA